MSIPHRIEMLAAGLEFCAQARVDVEANRWLRHQGVDVPAVVNLTGPIVQSRIVALPGGLFSFAGDRPDSFLAFVHVIHGDDAETPVDLIAWTKDRPAAMYRYFAYADCIASDQVGNPTSYFAGSGLQIHDTALDWLKRGCSGAVVLDADAFRHRLTNVKPKIKQIRLVGSTIARARELARQLSPMPDRVQIFVPASETVAA